MRTWTTSTLGERVDYCIKKSGLDHNEFARKAGVETASLTRLKKDESIADEHHREAATLARVSQAASVDLLWLATGEGQPDIESAAELPPIDEDMLRRYPSKRQAAIMLKSEASAKAIAAMMSEEHYGSDTDPGGKFWIGRALAWDRDLADRKRETSPSDAPEMSEPPPMAPRPTKPKGKKGR